MDPVTTAALLKWIEALGFPTWALVILIAWISLRRELRTLSDRWAEMAKGWRESRLEMENRITWLESGFVHRHARKEDTPVPRKQRPREIRVQRSHAEPTMLCKIDSMLFTFARTLSTRSPETSCPMPPWPRPPSLRTRATRIAERWACMTR